MAESKELKSLLRKVKEENEKYGLKLKIQKSEIIASSPITSWQIDGETMETQFLQIVTAAMKLKDASRTWKQPRCPSADEWIRKL